MIFKETPLKGAYLIQPEPIQDERGFFARTYCAEEFTERGLNPRVTQCNLSYNRGKYTLRGLHYQLPPFSEAKLVACLSGSIYDVIVDLRSESPTYCQWLGIELSSRQPRSMLYVPENFAHGFQTLEDDTEIFYQMSQSYHANSARGVRWNDPLLNIQWPCNEPIMSAKDQRIPDFVCERKISRIEQRPS